VCVFVFVCVCVCECKCIICMCIYTNRCQKKRNASAQDNLKFVD
jgi:hypothetical protein